MIPYIPFSAWWCCLNPREKDLLIFCEASWVTNPTFMYREVFDAAAAATGELASALALAYFMQFYGLEYQLIPCGEDCVIDAVVFTGGFWPLLAAFAITDGLGCASPCRCLTFPL